jgi:hypothetical protein
MGAGGGGIEEHTSMTHTVRLTTNIPDSRRIELSLPSTVPTRDAEVVLVVVPKGDRRHSTGKDLAASAIFGMWADRTDIAGQRQLRARDARALLEARAMMHLLDSDVVIEVQRGRPAAATWLQAHQPLTTGRNAELPPRMWHHIWVKQVAGCVPRRLPTFSLVSGFEGAP